MGREKGKMFLNNYFKGEKGMGSERDNTSTRDRNM